MDEEIKNKKKPWQKSELIVLVRSKPEEAVLVSCKSTVTVIAGCGVCIGSDLFDISPS